jgi:hypothetical protein
LFEASLLKPCFGMTLADCRFLRWAMTESDWQSTTDPGRMLRFLMPTRPKRKLALFGVACARRIPRLCQEPASAAAIAVSERYADRRAKISELRVALRNAGPPPGDYSRYSRAELDRYLAEHAVLCNAASNAELVSEYALKAAHDRGTEKRTQCDLLREVFGNPFRKVRARKDWLTSTVRQLAEATYTDNAFGGLPILADALEDAGCEDRDILSHCRGPGSHVRGCWVVDLVLGKR